MGWRKKSPKCQFVLIDKGYTPEEGEYLYLLGGDVAGSYTAARFSADWYQNFCSLSIASSNTFAPLYEFDQGNGSRKINATYFPAKQGRCGGPSIHGLSVF